MTTQQQINEPVLIRDAEGRIDYDSVPDVIQWFLDYDQRVAIIKHPQAEEVFQWKQEQSRQSGEDVFHFNRAEDRLAIGIIHALAENPNEQTLHNLISQVINALDSASRSNESAADSYGLNLGEATSTIAESEKIPSRRGRVDFLMNCWVETLCTAEVRVLGWLYREIYGRPFAPR